MSEMNWFMRQIYCLMLKEGWKVKCLAYMDDNMYHIELVDPCDSKRYFIATLTPEGYL